MAMSITITHTPLTPTSIDGDGGRPERVGCTNAVRDEVESALPLIQPTANEPDLFTGGVIELMGGD